ncbi:MAG: hypothetical protein QNL43_09220 [Crocinitomicaceae bacterium]|jgi:uncharacterized membrane protein|tara:strand:- start:13373 stop:13837 length:465 start_codon:yes stop_codon:yes gene_type:complete
MKEEKMNLILTITRYALVLIGVGLSVMLFSGPTVADGKAAMTEFRESGSMSAIYYTLFIIVTAVVAVLGFFMYQIAMQPKKTLLSIVGIVVAFVLYFVMYFSGSSDTMKSLALRHEASDSVIAATSAGVYTIGICLAVGVLVVVFGPLMGRYRK